MAALSINLPNRLALDSKELASRLGISRSEFIRMAIAHEITRLKKQFELEAMAQTFEAMKDNSDYLEESKNIIDEFDDDLPEDEDEWWK